MNKELREIRNATDRVGKRFMYGILTGLWLQRLDQITQEVEQLCKGLDQAQLNWKPNPESWSVAQVMEHLVKVNSSYYPSLKSLHAGTYRLAWTSKIPLLPKFLGRMIINSVKPTNPRKTRTFPVWEPAQSSLPPSIYHDFVRHQSELKEHITSSADLLERGTLIASPANPRIVYTLEDAFEIMVTHEERHLGQMKNVLTLMNRS